MEPDYNYICENWKNCDVMDLAKNFYGLKSEASSQYERIGKFKLSSGDLGKLLNDPEGELSGAALLMALSREAPDSREMSFTPVLSCTYTVNGAKQDPVYAVFDPVWGGKYMDSVIPSTFAEILNQNWFNLDNRMLDDVFVADKSNRFKQRLHGYYFKQDDNVNPLLIDLLNVSGVGTTSRKNLITLNFYLGVDYNKFNQKDEFSFSPIIELVFGRVLTDEEVGHYHRKGFRYVENENDEGCLFLEYIRPCPPTCPD